MTSFDEPVPSKNIYVIDIESGAETARLIEQDKLITRAMGGLFPEQPDLSAVKRILDIGCGPGGWVIEVAFQYANIDVLGIDINATMIEYAQAQVSARGYENAHFQVVDVKKPLDFPDASFDLINARFITGFMDQTSWRRLLDEVMRLLTPGGRLRFTEAEMVISSSPALQQINKALNQTLARQGRTFSIDGLSGGLTPHLSRLLMQAGAEKIGRRAFCLESSNGTELYSASYKNNEIGVALLKPYLTKSGALTEEEFDSLYQAMLIEMLDEEYVNVMYGLTAWGFKPA